MASFGLQSQVGKNSLVTGGNCTGGLEVHPARFFYVKNVHKNNNCIV